MSFANGPFFGLGPKPEERGCDPENEFRAAVGSEESAKGEKIAVAVIGPLTPLILHTAPHRRRASKD